MQETEILDLVMILLDKKSLSEMSRAIRVANLESKLAKLLDEHYRVVEQLELAKRSEVEAIYEAAPSTFFETLGGKAREFLPSPRVWRFVL